MFVCVCAGGCVGVFLFVCVQVCVCVQGYVFVLCVCVYTGCVCFDKIKKTYTEIFCVDMDGGRGGEGGVGETLLGP